MINVVDIDEARVDRLLTGSMQCRISMFPCIHASSILSCHFFQEIIYASSLANG